MVDAGKASPDFFTVPDGPDPFEFPKAIRATPPDVVEIPAISRADQAALMEASGVFPHVGKKPNTYITDPPTVETTGIVRVGSHAIPIESVVLGGARKRTKSQGR